MPLDFAAALEAFRPCECPRRPLDLCEHPEPCIRREGLNLGAYCASCTLDLAVALADCDVPPIEAIHAHDVARVKVAIALSLCPSCADVARAQLEDLPVIVSPAPALARRIGGAR